MPCWICQSKSKNGEPPEGGKKRGKKKLTLGGESFFREVGEREEKEKQGQGGEERRHGRRGETFLFGEIGRSVVKKVQSQG